MAKHMGHEDRKRIEFLLDCGKTIAEIARDIGRPESTVSREIQNRRIDSDRRYGCSNRLCRRYDDCELRLFGATGTVLRKNRARCFDGCPAFFEATCDRWAKAPFVCNGCEEEPYCPLRKNYYRSEGAQENYLSNLHDSRIGAQPDEETFRKMDEILSPCIRKGQSARNVIANNPDVFGRFKERTVYDWINGGLFRAKRSDLPFACARRKQPKKAEIKTNAKCRVGRSMREMWAWLKEHADVVPCELDTVVGRIGGKVLFTMIFPETGLSLAFLRDAKTSQTCTRLFNMLWEKAGAKLFRRLFAAILTDNGSEFSDPEMIENYRPDPEHNPCRLESRGVKVWYAAPYCSTQKPHIERVHEEIRRILIKGSSFNALDQDQVDLVMSHVNSCTRPTLGNRTPHDLFAEKYGEEGRKFLESLNIRRIPANQVTLHPFLLGQKFQRHADSVILKRAGVTTQAQK